MSIQICRALELMMRSACCRAIKNRPCVHNAVLVPMAASGHRVPGVPVLHKRAYSLDARSPGPGRPALGASAPRDCAERTSSSSSVAQRNLSAVAPMVKGHPECEYDIFNHKEFAKHIYRRRQFILDPDLAKLVTEHLGPDISKTILFECSPGPGVLTKALLNAGAPRVVALEPHKLFLPELRDLERRLDGQLDVVHCDFFKMDPNSDGIVRPPTMFSEKLFTDLGISEAGWTDDIPVRVVGFLPLYKERSKLLRIVYALFQQQSFYRYGRVELNLFIREEQYLKLLYQAGNLKSYSAPCIFHQMAYDMKVLLKVPSESFAMVPKYSTTGAKKRFSFNMCLVRLRPRADLFSTGLCPSKAETMLVMLQQCMVKRKVKLIDRLNLWAPDSGRWLLSEMGMKEDILTGQVRPDEYLRLFLLMDNSDEFTQSWLYEELLEHHLKEERF